MGIAMARAAGVAGSRREGKIVFYALTPLGRALIDSHVALLAALA
jgi:hypothetical protein